MVKKRPPINYTSREFDTIKRDLVDYAKRYYPDTFKDFNDASFGALMLDTVAYVGDILSFYLDYQANESFLDTALEYDNIINLARQQGYKFQTSALSQGMANLFVLVPANSSGIGPDTSYMPVLRKGSEFTAADGQNFTLLEDVDFGAPDLDTVVSSVNATGTPTFYAIKAPCRVISGQLARETVTVGDFERYLKIDLDASNIAEIVSVIDNEGHRYFEVDHLSQNIVYVSVTNKSTDRYTVKNIMKPIVVPRRFVAEAVRNRTSLQFGYGSSSEIKSESIADPSEVIMNVHGKNHETDHLLDPTKLISSDKFGIAPSNTTITVTYRVNPLGSANVSAGALNNVVRTFFQFDNRTTLDEATIATVEDSLEISNDEPITGGSQYPTIDELKQRVKSHYFAQNRAVTKQDYVSLVYQMPGAFGAVRKCSVSQDVDSFKRNLNIYVVSSNSDNVLSKSGETLKENLKTWINRYKMVNDTIDILDAHVVNIGIKFTVIGEPSQNKAAILTECARELRSNLELIGDIGQSMSLSQVYKVLNRVPGVIDTTSVQFVLRTGTRYSDVFYNIDDNVTSDGRTLMIPEDHILEIKYPIDDIEGTII